MEGLLAFVAFGGLVLGAINVARPSGRLHITTRARGAGLMAASLVVASAAGALGPQPDVDDTSALPAASTTTSSPGPYTSTAPSSTTSTTLPPTTTTTLPDVPQADVLFAAPSAGASGDPSASAPAGSGTMTVTEIVDGDTIEVLLPAGESDTLRLIGVNSPEVNECFATEAALVLRSLIPVGTTFHDSSDVSDRDQYGRLLRYLWVGGMSVNEELVRRGAAIARRYPPDTAMAPKLEGAQEEARTRALGLWEPDACGPDAGTEITVVSLQADSPGDDNTTLNQEVVRIRNGGPLGVDMTGWVLRDESSSHRFDFPAGFVLAAGGTIQVHTGCGTDSSTSLYWCNSGAVWNNDGDTAFILDHNGNVVHSLPYVPPTTTTATSTTQAPPPTEGSDCHPSYTGACVPIVSDVDCAGGSGNGPYYVGRVTVVGPDVYDLDRDNDGVGCE